MASKDQENGKEHISYRDLPLISSLPDTQFKRAKALLQELEKLQVATERMQAIKDELADIQDNCGRDGLRLGKLCFVAREQAGRRTLNRDMLVEAGVLVRTIEKCYKEGDPFVTKTFKVLED